MQTHYLATTLAKLGLRVCHIVYDGPGVPAETDGVELIHTPPPQPGRGRARYVREELASLAAADASVYVQRNAGSSTGMVALFARGRRRRFVLSVSWDGDLELKTPIGGRLARGSYRTGMRLADTIVVQTEDQFRRGRELTGRPLKMIRSFAEDAGDAGDERRSFLWIGRVVDYKDPLAYVDLADRVPEASFRMVADASGGEAPALLGELRERADRLPNLELLAPLPRDQLLDLYSRAVAVVNTSHVEGFPNTFLEGWARGAPALSLRLDPDRIIRQRRLGSFAAGSRDQLAAAAREMWALRSDPAMSERTRAYIRAEHSPRLIASRWKRLLDELTKEG